MSKFKVGIDVRVIGLSKLLHPGIKIGDVRNVTATCSNGVQLDGFSDGWVYDIHIETLKPKWSIYNNTLQWSELSDKQKGKLLLAAHSGANIGGRGFLYLVNPVKFVDPNRAYFAVKSKTVKPEPTMAELFKKDWYDCFCDEDKYEQMIARGWNKPCK